MELAETKYFHIPGRRTYVLFYVCGPLIVSLGFFSPEQYYYNFIKMYLLNGLWHHNDAFNFLKVLKCAPCWYFTILFCGSCIICQFPLSLMDIVMLCWIKVLCSHRSHSDMLHSWTIAFCVCTQCSSGRPMLCTHTYTHTHPPHKNAIKSEFKNLSIEHWLVQWTSVQLLHMQRVFHGPMTF